MLDRRRFLPAALALHARGVVAQGLAAASKGDVAGTLGAIAELGGPDTKVGRIAGRLESVAGLLKL